MSSSLLQQQCPGYLDHLTWIVCEMGGKWPCSCCFVGCCFQVLFKTACKTLIVVSIYILLLINLSILNFLSIKTDINQRLFWDLFLLLQRKKDKKKLFPAPNPVLFQTICSLTSKHFGLTFLHFCSCLYSATRGEISHLLDSFSTFFLLFFFF